MNPPQLPKDIQALLATHSDAELGRIWGSLRFLLQNGLLLHNITKSEIVTLDVTGHGYAEYRVMIDNEVDQREDWTPYQYQGKSLVLSHGDIVIQYGAKKR